MKVKGMSSMSPGNLFQFKLLNFHYGYVKFRTLSKRISICDEGRYEICSGVNSLLKDLSESFDALRTNGERFELPEKFPFMLSLSKHSLLFSTVC